MKNNNNKESSKVQTDGINSADKHLAKPAWMHDALGIEEEWQAFQQNLAVAMADLEEDEFLVLTEKRSGIFVQFFAQGHYGMRMEAISNCYLREDTQLTQEQVKALLDAGWNAPTYTPKKGTQKPATGSPNFYIDAAVPIPFDEVAALAVMTLRKVYYVGHPGELEYSAGAMNGTQIRFPLLRIKRATE